MISFLAGKPNPKTFPFDSITLKMKPVLGKPEVFSNGVSENGVPEAETITISGEQLDEALQYGPTAGLPDLLKVSLLFLFATLLYN